MFLKKFFFITKDYFFLCLRVIISFFTGGMKCVCCNKISYSMPLCKTCRTKLLESSKEQQNCCRICSKPLVSENELCMECRENAILKSADSVKCLFTYRLWKKQLLFSWKMENQRSLSRFFALAIINELKNSGINLKQTAIVPIPPRPGKLRVRGWDQIDELSKYLKYFYSCKIMSLLKRKSKNQQKKLDRNQRLDHKNKNYYLSNYCNKLIKMNFLPKEVILLDDVLTTGLTTEECSSLLKKAGVLKVRVLTLFIVD